MIICVMKLQIASSIGCRWEPVRHLCDFKPFLIFRAGHIQDIKRSFPVIVDVGSGVAALLRHAEVLKSKGVQRIVHIDLSQKMLDRDKHLIQNSRMCALAPRSDVVYIVHR